MDADGAVVIPQDCVEDVLSASRAREGKEATNREKFESGVLSIDLYGLREELAPLLVET